MNILKPMARGSEKRMDTILSLAKEGKTYIMEQKNDFFWIGEKIGSIKVTKEELESLGGAKNLEPSNISLDLKKRLIKNAKDAKIARRNKMARNTC